MTNLVIDIGNTRTKAAIFRQGEMLHREAWDELSPEALRAFAYNQKAENIILSSTANVPDWVEDFFKNDFQYLHLTHETPLPIGIHYATPATLGRDRIAAATGAWARFPSENVLVIDAGSCITMDLVDDKGVFQGGNISPGIEMRLKAMHHFTAKLPLVEATNRKLNNADYLGDSTESAIRNGGELGALLEVNGFMEFCWRRFRPLKIVLTGGDADFFVKNLKTKIFAHPNLVLEGLNQILQFNVNQPEGF